MAESDAQTGIKLNPAQEKSRRNRNMALGLILAALIVLFYAVTIVKLGPSVLNRPL